MSASIHLPVVGDSLARGWGASTPRKAFASLVYADVLASHPVTRSPRKKSLALCPRIFAQAICVCSAPSANANRTNALLSRDRVHPNGEGYQIMATEAAPIVNAMIDAR